MPIEELEEELKPLKIKCSSTDCKNDKHHFGPEGRRGRRRKVVEDEKTGCSEVNDGHEHCTTFQPGACRECGASPVDWTRLHRRDITDLANTNSSLKYGCWQHHWWEVAVDPKATQEARNSGRIGSRTFAEKRLREKVAPATIFRDGVQTPREGNIVFYAQHATATCCRKCLSYWHGIPPGHEMSNDELSYCVGLIMAYVDERLPALTEEGTVLCLPL